jgi:two-component system, OmpR family, response regulator MtrA
VEQVKYAMSSANLLNRQLSISLATGALPNFDAYETCGDVAERRQRTGTRELRPLILIADDESLIRRTVVEILRTEGYDAVAVIDGAAAVECASRIEPQLLLVDVIMPGMNGIDAAKKIREAFPSVRVICFSGHASSSELIREAKEQGYDFEFLTKPIRPQALLNSIREILG